MDIENVTFDNEKVWSSKSNLSHIFIEKNSNNNGAESIGRVDQNLRAKSRSGQSQNSCFWFGGMRAKIVKMAYSSRS